MALPSVVFELFDYFLAPNLPRYDISLLRWIWTIPGSDFCSGMIFWCAGRAIVMFFYKCRRTIRVLYSLIRDICTDFHHDIKSPWSPIKCSITVYFPIVQIIIATDITTVCLYRSVFLCLTTHPSIEDLSAAMDLYRFKSSYQKTLGSPTCQGGQTGSIVE